MVQVRFMGSVLDKENTGKSVNGGYRNGLQKKLCTSLVGKMVDPGQW